MFQIITIIITLIIGNIINYFICIFIGLLLSFSFKFVIVNVLNVTEVELVEAFSIPPQNIAYIIKNNGNISKKEYK